MNFRPLLSGALAAALITAAPVSAERLGIRNSWSLTPENDMNHPQHKVLALVAQQRMSAVTCRLYYGHGRGRYETGSGDSVQIKPPKGGTIEVTLEVLTKAGSVELDQKKYKRNGGLGWVDRSGSEDGDRSYKKTKGFPLKLKSGDAVLFSLDFKGMPKVLGVKRESGEIQLDGIYIDGECLSCGSNDSPCP